MSQVRSSSILVHMQKGVSILCRADYLANAMKTLVVLDITRLLVR